MPDHLHFTRSPRTSSFHVIEGESFRDLGFPDLFGISLFIELAHLFGRWNKKFGTVNKHFRILGEPGPQHNRHLIGPSVPEAVSEKGTFGFCAFVARQQNGYQEKKQEIRSVGE